MFFFGISFETSSEMTALHPHGAICASTLGAA